MADETTNPPGVPEREPVAHADCRTHAELDLPSPHLIGMTDQMASIPAGFLRRRPGPAPQKQVTRKTPATVRPVRGRDPQPLGGR